MFDELELFLTEDLGEGEKLGASEWDANMAAIKAAMDKRPRGTVGAEPPEAPAVNDIWFQPD
jgi:hypothetical protein